MDLGSIVGAYRRLHLSRALLELGYFHDLPSLELCIDRVALAINRNGKKFKHQWKI